MAKRQRSSRSSSERKQPCATNSDASSTITTAATNGAFVIAAADLLGSTSINKVGETFPPGFYNRQTNPGSRTARHRRNLRRRDDVDVVRHLGVRLAHRRRLVLRRIQCAARTHRRAAARDRQPGARQPEGGAYRPFFLICAHAGLKTGEDGPTHADPQPLQLLQDNFPLGTMITLTPWDPQEVWFLVSAALAKRPAMIAPFVTRPRGDWCSIAQRTACRRPSLAAQGVYRLRAAHGHSQGTIVLQGTGVTNAFVTETLPLINNAGLSLNVYVVTSSELFDLLPSDEREQDLPRSASTGGDGHHRLHPGDDESLDPLRSRPRVIRSIRSGTIISSAAARARW